MNNNRNPEKRIFKTKWFVRFAQKQDISDADLCRAVEDAKRGIIDADLGGGVIKQRIARPQEGKSGGFRAIVLFQVEQHCFFVYGFPKNQRSNITANELKEFRALATELLNLNETQLKTALDAGKFQEVTCYEKNL